MAASLGGPLAISNARGRVGFCWLVLLEAGWVFLGYFEVIFEGEAGTGDGAFVEEAAD